MPRRLALTITVLVLSALSLAPDRAAAGGSGARRLVGGGFLAGMFAGGPCTASDLPVETHFALLGRLFEDSSTGFGGSAMGDWRVWTRDGFTIDVEFTSWSPNGSGAIVAGTVSVNGGAGQLGQVVIIPSWHGRLPDDVLNDFPDCEYRWCPT